MNNITLIGRLTRDPEVRYSTGENSTCIARFSIAVQRKFKNAEGNYEADFPNIIAFGKQSEFIEKYFHKGDMIGIRGRIQTGSYTNKDGVKVYTTDVVAEDVEFVGSKNDNSTTPANPSKPVDDGFINVPEGIDDELPFS